ncbi:MAG: sigma-70 family RNA polymerase sigma factor [Gaiellaceae bacterium]
MDESTWLAEKFEEHRPRLTALASRMLGSKTEADDAVQEAWIRFNHADASDVDNLGAWLTTIVSRLCLNALQSRRTRSSESLDADFADTALEDTEAGPEREVLLADSVGLALLIVLDRLTPTERVAFVLHDMFAIPFEDIAPIVGRNAAATRQLASRARRRVHHSDVGHEPDRLRQSRLVDAFLSAARRGDFVALVELLDPDVVVRCDAAALALGAEEARGAETVAATAKRARGVQPALIDGAPAAIGLRSGELRIALLFTFSTDRITAIEVVAEPKRLATLDLLVVGDA